MGSMHTLNRTSGWLAVALGMILGGLGGVESAVAQSASSAAADSISRYGNLNVERSSGVIDPELGQKHYRRGNTYNNLKRFDEAIAEYQLAITADPTFADSYRQLANIFYFQERFDDAIPMLARFIDHQREVTAGLIASLNTLGQLLRDAQRFDEAIEIDLRAIENDAGNASQIYVMGNTYANAGRTAEAIRVYEKALTVAPPDAFVHRTLGRLLEQEQRLEEALAQYRAAAAIDPASQFYKDLITGLEARLAR
ncbi:MAG: tetratricopeptide repeat protein [Gammaproteobacteria bacterium]|nr:tetratricopeptide repeat protein [Gammaproteobacteria bacterium]